MNVHLIEMVTHAKIFENWSLRLPVLQEQCAEEKIIVIVLICSDTMITDHDDDKNNDDDDDDDDDWNFLWHAVEVLKFL